MMPGHAGIAARAFGRDDAARLIGPLYGDGDAVIADVTACYDTLICDILLSSMVEPFREPGLRRSPARPHIKGRASQSCLPTRPSRRRGLGSAATLGS